MNQAIKSGWQKLRDSSVFNALALILTAGFMLVLFKGLTPISWLDAAMVGLGIYASKEGVKYASSAYENKP